MSAEIWAVLRADERVEPVGELKVATVLHAGDGGTFACHVKEKVARGTWQAWRVNLEEFHGPVVLARTGAAPVTWEDAGVVCIDTATVAFFPGAALKELGDVDEDFAEDVIAEAIFDDANESDAAVIETPEGRPFVVFRVGGDGTYGVTRGRDAEGQVVALVVDCC